MPDNEPVVIDPATSTAPAEKSELERLADRVAALEAENEAFKAVSEDTPVDAFTADEIAHIRHVLRKWHGNDKP